MTFLRALTPYIMEDLNKKMVFVAGPRQVGKTTLSREMLAASFPSFSYLNWDSWEDRRVILEQRWPNVALIILDEFHKYKRWKSFMKGFYDKYGDRYRIVVTGSARLDTFRKGGDSLQGRYFYFRLHPFSVSELQGHVPVLRSFEPLVFAATAVAVVSQLLERGGFPEPYMMTDERERRRWRHLKLERLFREDVRDTTMVRDIGQMAILSQLLAARVSGGLSLDNLARDIEVDHRTVKNWIEILESLYYCYRVYPYQKNVTRALKKQSKLYLWDWSEVTDVGARFENLVSGHLLKLVHFLQDYEGYKAELWYLRDTVGHEVDFLVTVDGRPWFMVEAKHGDTRPSKSLGYFGEKLGVALLYQVVNVPETSFVHDGIHVISVDQFLTAIP